MTDDTRPETPDSAAAPSEVDPPPPAADEPAPPVAADDEAARERDEYRDLLLRKTAERVFFA